MNMKRNSRMKSIFGLALVLGLGWVMQAGAQVMVTQVVEAAASGPYGLGGGYESEVDIVVYLNESITSVTPAVDGTDKYPRIRLKLSPSNGYAIFQSRVGTNGILFRYTVKPGDFAQDLDSVAANGLDFGPASMVTSSGPFGPYQSLDLSSGANSLSGTSDINIQTVVFKTPPTATIPQYGTVTWNITRDGSGVGQPLSGPLALSVQSPPSPPSGVDVTYPSSTVISNGLRDANFALQGMQVGGPFVFRLRPAGYPPTGEGDLVVSNVNVVAGATPTFSISGPALALEEGALPVAETHTCTVTLSQPAISNVVITLTSGTPAALQIVGSGQVSIAAGESQAIFLVQALDGPASVTVGGSASHTYVLGTPAVVGT